MPPAVEETAGKLASIFTCVFLNAWLSIKPILGAIFCQY